MSGPPEVERTLATLSPLVPSSMREASLREHGTEPLRRVPTGALCAQCELEIAPLARGGFFESLDYPGELYCSEECGRARHCALTEKPKVRRDPGWPKCLWRQLYGNSGEAHELGDA